MKDIFRVTSVNYNYDFEKNEMTSVSVTFECQMPEINQGISSFAGTAQLPIEEASKYSIKEMDKAVKGHIANRLLGTTTAPEQTEVPE